MTGTASGNAGGADRRPLLLRPAGFDTLAVRVWMWASEGFYLQAAPAALFLVLISALPLSFLLHREKIFR